VKREFHPNINHIYVHVVIENAVIKYAEKGTVEDIYRKISGES
jgi:hypothetical protein